MQKEIDRPARQPAQPKLIMAIDNSHGILMLLADILTTAGYQFIGERNPRQGLARVQIRVPDLLLLDIEMPHMNGFELCRRVRESERAHAVPIVFLTGRNRPEDFRAGIEAGGNDYIVKPFTAITLLQRAGHWANQSLEVDL
jgi:DNA-binding response OmpR family regulator